jgi:hypothetical protein
MRLFVRRYNKYVKRNDIISREMLNISKSCITRGSRMTWLLKSEIPEQRRLGFYQISIVTCNQQTPKLTIRTIQKPQIDQNPRVISKEVPRILVVKSQTNQQTTTINNGNILSLDYPWVLYFLSFFFKEINRWFVYTQIYNKSCQNFLLGDPEEKKNLIFSDIHPSLNLMLCKFTFSIYSIHTKM